MSDSDVVFVRCYLLALCKLKEAFLFFGPVDNQLPDKVMNEAPLGTAKLVPGNGLHQAALDQLVQVVICDILCCTLAWFILDEALRNPLPDEYLALDPQVLGGKRCSSGSIS